MISAQALSSAIDSTFLMNAYASNGVRNSKPLRACAGCLRGSNPLSHWPGAQSNCFTSARLRASALCRAAQVLCGLSAASVEKLVSICDAKAYEQMSKARTVGAFERFVVRVIYRLALKLCLRKAAWHRPAR
jgi:hypothetical protein